jgi:sulfur-carrier protein
MKINVKYFASVREALGTDGEYIETDALNVAALILQLSLKSEAYASTLAHPRLCIAHNQSMVKPSSAGAALLAGGDEVAFFPPVTGG